MAPPWSAKKSRSSFVGEWHGIHRTIPVEYPGPHGTNYTLFLDVMSVTDENGNKLKYESSKSGAYRDLKIYIPGAVDTTRVVNIDYTVRNGVRFFDRLRRVLLERDRQRLAGSHRPCLGLRHLARKCRAEDCALRPSPAPTVPSKAKQPPRSKAPTSLFETTNPLAHARRHDHRHLYSAGSAQSSSPRSPS